MEGLARMFVCMARANTGLFVRVSNYLYDPHSLVWRSECFLRACNVWVIRCRALLCLAILNPLRYECSHVDRMWGHVSLSLRGHNVQLEFCCVKGQKIFFMWLPIYCAYLNFSFWVIWASVTCLFFHKWLDIFWFICVLETHLST